MIAQFLSRVILNVVKNLCTSTCAFQILRIAQDDRGSYSSFLNAASTRLVSSTNSCTESCSGRLLNIGSALSG